MRLVCMLAACLALAVEAAGQTIQGPETVKVGQAAWYWIEDLPPNAAFAWSPSMELQAGAPHIRDGHALLAAKTPGPRMLVGQMIVVDWATRQISVTPLSMMVAVEGDPVPPPPPPVPRPANPFPRPDAVWQQTLQPLQAAIETSRLPFSQARPAAETLGTIASQIAAGALTDSARLFEAIRKAGAGASLGGETAAALGAVMERQNPHEAPLDAGQAGWTLKYMAWCLWEHAIMEAAR